jgi:hypothetical protein
MGITNKAISTKFLNIIIRTNHGQTEIVMQYGGLWCSVTCVTTSSSNDSVASPTHRTSQSLDEGLWDVVWAGICHDGRTQLKIVQGTLNAVKYRDDILDPIVLPFQQQRNFDHVFQHDNIRCHVVCVCQDFLNQNHIRVLPWPALSPE